MLLGITHIENERICATFPCIGGAVEFDSNGQEIAASRIVDLIVITITEKEMFNLRRTDNAGQMVGGIVHNFRTFPAALRAARQSQGWR